MRTRLRGAFCVGNQSKIDYTGDYTVSNIVIAFPKPEVAANIRKILSQSGYTVTAVCTTGAKTLESVNNLEQGILICVHVMQGIMRFRIGIICLFLTRK